MAKLKEIEIKWDATLVERQAFNKKLSFFLKKKKIKYRKLVIDGFDYYYVSKDGDVWRHRKSENTNELTVKARVCQKSTKVRKEGNIFLSKKCGIEDISGTLSLVGVSYAFEIYKDCDIYFIQDGDAEVSIVWYIVKKTGQRDRAFAEVEVHGIGEKKSLKVLNKWSNIMNKLYNIGEKEIVHESLYEIYSGKKYKLHKD